MAHVRQAKFQIGQIVRHRFYPFRGVIFDVDPEFANTEDWWLSIPEDVRPKQGPAILPPSRRKRREHLHRIRLGAKPGSRQFRRAGIASAGRRNLCGCRERLLSDAPFHQSLKARINGPRRDRARVPEIALAIKGDEITRRNAGRVEAKHE